MGAGMAGCASSSARGVDHVFNEGLCREAQAQAWCEQLACTLTIANAHSLIPFQLFSLHHGVHNRTDEKEGSAGTEGWGVLSSTFPWVSWVGGAGGALIGLPCPLLLVCLHP